jgi:hypothetical protein
MDKKTKKQMVIGLLVFAAILFIYFKGKAAGKLGKAKKVKLPNDIIGGGSNTDPNTGQIINGSKIRSISVALHDDMNGYNVTGHDMTPYKDWVTLSNTGFVAVYNDFNKQYFSEGNGTLKEWIVDEMYRDSLVDDIILPRMASLNLV